MARYRLTALQMLRLLIILFKESGTVTITTLRNGTMKSFTEAFVKAIGTYAQCCRDNDVYTNTLAFLGVVSVSIFFGGKLSLSLLVQ